MLHFSVGFIWWAAQAEVHSSWTDVSCQRNMWTDHWRGSKESRLGPKQDLSMGCSKGVCPWVQTQGRQVSRAQPVYGGKAERRIILDKHHSAEESSNRGCQALQQKGVIFKCQLYHGRPKPPWVLMTPSHHCAPCLRTDIKKGKPETSISTLSRG